MRKRPSKFPGSHRVGLTLLYAVAGVLAVLMITGSVYTKQLLKEPGRTETVPAPTAAMEQVKMEEIVPASPAPDVQPMEHQPAQLDFGHATSDEKEIVNILLVGQDARSESGARSDTIILCTFNKERDTITMTSFLRDLYVKIPGHKSNRLNAAYSFGGIDLLKQTLQENFGIEVDGSIQVDFACFEEIIDTLGGVTIELTAAEASYINDNLSGCALTEGSHTLSGEQALVYARDRYDVDGDFSRTNRQRKLLSELIRTYKSKKITEMLRLMRDISKMVTMDISRSDLTTYALTLFPMLSSAQVKTQAIPVEDSYYDAKISGKWVLVPDLEKNIEALNDTLT